MDKGVNEEDRGGSEHVKFGKLGAQSIPDPAVYSSTAVALDGMNWLARLVACAHAKVG